MVKFEVLKKKLKLEHINFNRHQNKTKNIEWSIKNFSLKVVGRGKILGYKYLPQDQITWNFLFVRDFGSPVISSN